MSLDSLPPEIILNIASFFFPSLDPLNSLCQTNKRFHYILERILYTEDVQHHRSSSVYWAAGRGNLTVIRKAINLGKAYIPTSEYYASVQDDESKRQPAIVGQRTGLLYGRPGPTFRGGIEREHPICRAAHNGHDEVVKFLLDEVGCSPHIRDWRGSCLVSVGMVGGLDKETIQVLLDREVHQYVRNTKGSCPLDIAASNGDKDMVELLLLSTRPEYRDQQIQGSFQIALQAKQIPVALQLLDHGGVDMNCHLSPWTKDQKKYMTTPLGWAVFHGYLDLVKEFVEKGADVNFGAMQGERLAVSRRVLFDAVAQKKTDMVQFLVKRTTDRVARTKALSLAVDRASLNDDPASAENEVIEILLKDGVCCNYEEDDIRPPPANPYPQGLGGSTACWFNDGPEKEDGEFIPPIVYAVRAGNLRLVRLLISYGADVDTGYRQLRKTKTKFCCGRILDLAMDLGHQEIVDFLINLGAKPDLGRPSSTNGVNCDRMSCPVFKEDLWNWLRLRDGAAE